MAATEGKAVAYSIGMLKLAKHAAIEELRSPDVTCALIVDSAGDVPRAFESKAVLDLVDANELAERLSSSTFEEVMGQVRIRTFTKFLRGRYEVEGGLVLARSPAGGDIGPGAGSANYALTATGIQLPGPSFSSKGTYSYRCDPYNHKVKRAEGSQEKLCGKRLGDGSSCVGVLRAY